jgi:hypothetical protein
MQGDAVEHSSPLASVRGVLPTVSPVCSKWAVMAQVGHYVAGPMRRMIVVPVWKVECWLPTVFSLGSTKRVPSCSHIRFIEQWLVLDAKHSECWLLPLFTFSGASVFSSEKWGLWLALLCSPLGAVNVYLITISQFHLCTLASAEWDLSTYV